MPRLRSAVGAATLVLGGVAPIGAARAHAASACSPQEVTVVVDFGSLGSPLIEGCAPAQGNAASLFLAAGVRLRYAQQVPGAVCQVDDQPAATPCQQMPPGNAYWGLFWADGTTSHWTYSSFGVQSLTVPAGGSVAFAWQESTTTRDPAVSPPVTRSTASPSPTAAPHRRRTHAARPGAVATTTHVPSALSSVSSTASVSSATTTAPGSEVSVSATSGAPSTAPATSTALPTDATTATGVPASGTESTKGGGLPAWVPVGLIGLLVLAGGVVVAVRRRA